MRDLDSIIRSEAKAGIEGTKKAYKDVESDSKVVDFKVSVGRGARVNHDDATMCSEGTTKLSGTSCIVGTTKLSGTACTEGKTRLSGPLCSEGKTKLSGTACSEGKTKLSGTACSEGKTKLSGTACTEGKTNLSVMACSEGKTNLSVMACSEGKTNLSVMACSEGKTNLSVMACSEGKTNLSVMACSEGKTKLSDTVCSEGTIKLSGTVCSEGTSKLSGMACTEETTKLSGTACTEGTTRLSGMSCTEGTTKLSGTACTQGTTKLSGSSGEEIVCKDTKSGGNGLDPNANIRCKKRCEDLKLRDDSVCVSSVEETDSMRVWKGLKQHNFMSYSHETVPIRVPKHETEPIRVPKQRGRKKKSCNDDVTKKKTELVKRDQVDRFAFLAPPCGLLNGLRPGIISRVRNSKQVLSAIEALVRSERRDNRHSRTLPESNVELDSKMLALKISSPVAAVAEFSSCLSTEESGNSSSVSSLPVEAANVASQWLGLLIRDIKGRLAALGRSKARFFAVITTELPLLISREFSSNPDKVNRDAHIERWSSLFDRTYKSLSDEETHLESWLNQVNELQMLCDRGMCKQRLLGNNTRSEDVENNLEIMAAAASIYSTCNFLSSPGN